MKTSLPQPLVSAKSGPLRGTIKVPGDKSISHRALMFGSLCDGETIISGLLEGEDVINTAQAMRAMGAAIERGGDGLWRVYGVGTTGLRQPSETLDMGNSGTSARLLMGLISGHGIHAVMDGDASLRKRPMSRVMTPLEMMGARFEASEGGRLPLTIHGRTDLKAIEYRLPVASAQVKSAIILAGLRADGTTTVIENEQTRDHTENMLRHFGVDITTQRLPDNASAISIAGGQRLLPGSIDVPGDPSSAAFPIVAALINEGSEIEVYRVGINPRRTGLYDTLKEMGADIRFEYIRAETGENVANIIVHSGAPLKGITVPPGRVPSMIDEFPVLAMAAACAEGTTRMTGLAELRVKESDRLMMVARGLESCGVTLEMGADSLTIHGTGKPPAGGATIATALDHRIAMSFLVLGTATQSPVRIDDCAPIRTSFPDFVETMAYLGAEISSIDG